MFEPILTADQRKLRDEVREFVRSVPRQLILDMDADRIQYPRDYVREAGRRGLLGLRFPSKYGGRGLGWKDEIVAIEEVGVLGTSLACAYVMPSIVGEALNAFGTDEQKEHWLRPLVVGERVAAEALTEPRGGSDFFAFAVISGVFSAFGGNAVRTSLLLSSITRRKLIPSALSLDTSGSGPSCIFFCSDVSL